MNYHTQTSIRSNPHLLQRVDCQSTRSCFRCSHTLHTHQLQGASSEQQSDRAYHQWDVCENIRRHLLYTCTSYSHPITRWHPVEIRQHPSNTVASPTARTHLHPHCPYTHPDQHLTPSKIRNGKGTMAEPDPHASHRK